MMMFNVADAAFVCLCFCRRFARTRFCEIVWLLFILCFKTQNMVFVLKTKHTLDSLCVIAICACQTTCTNKLSILPNVGRWGFNSAICQFMSLHVFHTSSHLTSWKREAKHTRPCHVCRQHVCFTSFDMTTVHIQHMHNTTHHLMSI